MRRPGWQPRARSIPTLRDQARFATTTGTPADQTLSLWRVHRTAGPHSLSWNELRHFGPVATCRYDPHEPPPGPGKSEGVMYLAVTAQTALAEAFQARRMIDRPTDSPHLIGLRLTRTVRSDPALANRIAAAADRLGYRLL